MEQRRAYERDGLRYPSDMTDAEWALAEPFIPPAGRGGRERTVDVRAVLNGILHVLATGCQWRALPEDLPPRSTVHGYLTLWAWEGTLGRLHHIVGTIRRRWPRVDILVRGDSHYGRPEAMAWCERNRVAYLFGRAGNKVLLAQAAGLAEVAALERVEGETSKVRRWTEFPYAAKTWGVERRVIAQVEASDRGTDSRFVVTNLAGTPRWLYEEVYCGRGQAENLIKAHKRHLASDRTSCTKATANQFRLVLHTAACWLLHTLRGLAPKASFWRDAQLDTIRLAPIKVAGRVTELATRIEVALPSACPDRDSLILLAARAARPP